MVIQNLDMYSKVDIRNNVIPPRVPAVYLFCETNGDVLYIGRTENLRRRWKEHSRKKKVIPSEGFMLWKPCELREAHKLEKELILKYIPPLNTKLISGRQSSRHTLIKFRCKNCNRRFKPNRDWQNFCTPICRQKFYREAMRKLYRARKEGRI